MTNAKAESGVVWTAVVSLWLLLMIAFGGTSLPSPQMLAAHSVSATLLIIVSLWRLRHGFPGRLSAIGVGLVVLTFLLVATHLIPLPPAIWQSLPGRILIFDTMKLSGLPADHWMPLSLAPQMTRLALLALLPSFATLLALLSFERRQLPAIGVVLIVAAVACVLIGLLQRNAPADSALHFYGFRGAGKPTGTFGNSNFFATQLFVSIPFLAAVAMTLQEQFAIKGWLVFVFACAYAAVVLLGLGAIGSRAGIVFAMASVVATVFIVYRSPTGNVQKKFGFLPFVVTGSLLILGQVGMAAILQLAGSDPLADYRSTMLGVSMETTKAFFPVGSGFGSFVPVYQLFEKPDTMLSAYVNHVHNDWLEIVLEGGLAAAILLFAFLIIFIWALVSVFRLASNSSVNSYFRASAVALVLMLVHSLLDYPLRTPALSVIAAACFGIMLTARSNGSQFARRRVPNRQTKSFIETNTPSTFRREQRASTPRLENEVKIDS